MRQTCNYDFSGKLLIALVHLIRLGGFGSTSFIIFALTCWNERSHFQHKARSVTGIACVFDGAAGMINAGRELGSGFPAQGDRV